MIKPIYQTLKADRTLKNGATAPAGTSFLVGIVREELDGKALEAKEAALVVLAGRIARSKDKEEKKALRLQLKTEEARGLITIRGQEFLLLLSRVHPSVKLDNAEASALGRLLKGSAFSPELVAEA